MDVVYIVLAILAIIVMILLVPPTQARRSMMEWMRNIMKIRFRIPITLVNSEREHAISKTKQTREKINQEQIFERQTIIRQLQAVAERLFKNSQGANSKSIISIFRNIINEPLVGEFVAKNKLTGQCVHLINNELDDLFNKAGSFYSSTEGLTVNGLDDAVLNSIFNTTRGLIFDYRSIVDEVRECFSNFANIGIDPLWEKAPWSKYIHRELADNYEVAPILRTG